MSGQSNVGNAQVYEAGDQRNYTQAELEEQKKDARFHEGKENSHKANDSSSYSYILCLWMCSMREKADVGIEDSRTIANKLAREEKVRVVQFMGGDGWNWVRRHLR